MSEAKREKNPVRSARESKFMSEEEKEIGLMKRGRGVIGEKSKRIEFMNVVEVRI